MSNKVINIVIFRTITWRIISSENKLMVNKRISDFSSLQEECKEGAGNSLTQFYIHYNFVFS